MKALGAYTGTIYTEKDFEENKIHECFVWIDNDRINDKNWIETIHTITSEKCNKCKCVTCVGYRKENICMRTLRLGCFTGKIYTQEDFDLHKIEECALLIDPSKANDDNFIKTTYARIHKNCETCVGCPESMKQGGNLK